MGDGAEPQEKRGYPRIEVSVHVEIRVNGRPRAAHGITFNLGRSGMLAHLDGVIAPGTECSIQFPSSGSEPGQMVKGRAFRFQQGAGVTMAAFKFDTLLELGPLLEVAEQARDEVDLRDRLWRGQ